MNNIEKIKAEIARLMKETEDSQFDKGERYGLKTVLDFINSLPEEKLSEDLEEAAEEYVSKTLCDPDDGPSTGLAKESFIAGAEWQKEQMMKDAMEIITVQGSLTEPEFVKQRVIFLKED